MSNEYIVYILAVFGFLFLITAGIIGILLIIEFIIKFSKEIIVKQYIDTRKTQKNFRDITK